LEKASYRKWAQSIFLSIYCAKSTQFRTCRQDIKNSQLEEALNDRTDEEMDLSDSDNEHNDSDNCVSCPKKIRLEDDNKNLHQLKVPIREMQLKLNFEVTEYVMSNLV